MKGTFSTDNRVLTMLERHFSPRTLAELWGVSEDTIHRMFEDECVLRTGQGKNDYPRIPESVAVKVYEKNFRRRA